MYDRYVYAFLYLIWIDIRILYDVLYQNHDDCCNPYNYGMNNNYYSHLDQTKYKKVLNIFIVILTEELI
jgi:hypothetical protein